MNLLEIDLKCELYLPMLFENKYIITKNDGSIRTNL